MCRFGKKPCGKPLNSGILHGFFYPMKHELGNEAADKKGTKKMVNTNYAGIKKDTLEFVGKQLGLYPDEIIVCRQGTSLIITMRNFLSDAEKHVAVADKHIAEKIAKTISEAFRSVSALLEVKVSRNLGKNISEISIIVDVSINCASIFMKVESN